MIDFMYNHWMEAGMIFVGFISTIVIMQYKGNNTEKKVDNLSSEIGGIKDTLHLIQIENIRTSERTLNTQEQLKEIKEQLKDFNRSRNAKTN
jgi:hypothetical protein